MDGIVVNKKSLDHLIKDILLKANLNPEILTSKNLKITNAN